MQKIGNLAVVLGASCHVVKWVALNLCDGLFKFYIAQSNAHVYVGMQEF